MLTPSLSRAAARARWRSCAPVTARALALGLALVVLAGCTPSTSGPPAGTAVAPTSAPAGSSSPSASGSATPTPTLATLPSLPDGDRVLARLAKVSRSGIGTSGVAVLSTTGALVAARGADTPLAPASTLKVLTSLAALDTLGAGHTFTTRVVGVAEGKLVLVGGGDPLLIDKASAAAAKAASLQELAARTAEALAASGVRKVSLGYDDSLFTGPDHHPAWKASWRGYLARVSPLVVGSGRFNAWQSDPQPARTAARAFAKRLAAEGVKVGAVRRAKAPAEAATVAEVQSAPLSLVVERTLRLSDNLAADILARHVALAAGEPASFTGAAAALKDWLVAHDLWAEGMRVVDGSGLSSRSRVTPSVLARALVSALGRDGYAAIAAGLPVAGETGTLKDRFNDKAERIARGNVHAKTGTLPGISGLAGHLTTRDGTPLVFAVIANGAVGQTTAYNWLDRSVAALVRCGCG